MVVVKVEVDSGLKYRDRLFPGPERTSHNIPKETVAIREELARIKADRLARRAVQESKDRTQDNL
ncbi:hypothetical protein Ac2012v2_001497 [Leucoagaricus gongylophorus]